MTNINPMEVREIPIRFSEIQILIMSYLAGDYMRSAEDMRRMEELRFLAEDKWEMTA